MLPSFAGHLLPWKASVLEPEHITSRALAAPSLARKEPPSPPAPHTDLRSPHEPTSTTHSVGWGGRKKLTFPNLYELKMRGPWGFCLLG